MGYDGHRITPGYAATPTTLASLQPELTNGLWSFAPSPDLDSPAYAAVQKILGTQNPDPYSCQVYDHVNLIALSIAKSGQNDRNRHPRRDPPDVSQGNGQEVQLGDRGDAASRLRGKR